MRRLAAVLLLVSAPAQAQMTLPADHVSAEEARQFQLCRAAALYHIEAADPAATIPPPVARTLLDQMNVIMADSLSYRHPSDTEDALRLLRFTENWILGFSRVIQEEGARLTDLRTREQVLNGCVPVVWTVLRTTLDEMVLWRNQAIEAPEMPSPEEVERRQKALIRRLIEGGG